MFSDLFNSTFALISLVAPIVVIATPITTKGIAYMKPAPALDIPAHAASNTVLPSIRSLTPFSYVSLFSRTVFIISYIPSDLVER